MNRLSIGIPLSIFLFFMAFAAKGQCGCTDCRCSDSLELVRLFDATNGVNWRNNTGWKLSERTTMTLDTWYGVTLTNGRVTCIDLDGDAAGNNFSSILGNRLEGTIPNLVLPNLIKLYLTNNKLSAAIPNFNLPNLQELALGGNLLSNKIPNFNLPKLQYLFLGGNQLIDKIPNFNLPNLQYINLAGNQLSGRIPNFNLPKLKTLYFHDNQLSDSIPNFSLDSLQILSLHNNQLSGSIPNFNLNNLVYLYLYNNQLTDTIPKFNLPKLELIDLSTNQLSGCIPRQIKTNCSRIGADFSSFQFRGGNISNNPNLATQSWANYWNNNEGACTIQDTNSCRYKDSLQLVNLYNATGGTSWANQWNFNQPITTWYGIRTNTEGCVTYIDLDGNADFNTGGSANATGNKLTGQLPTLTFSELLYLFLDNNQLSGTLPAMNTPKIKNLAISYNPLLRGTIPTAWNFPDIEYLSLCCNGLDGVLPTLNFPKLLGIYLQNNKLNGTLPTLNLPLVRELDFGENRFSNCFPAAYRVLCPITVSFKNFDKNPLLPNNGDFAAFCTNNTGSCQNIGSCRYQDSLALVDLYKNYGGTNWTAAYRWNLNQPMTTWKGVQLNAQGCVGCLDLDGDAYDCDPGIWWSDSPPGIGLKGNGFPTPICRLTELFRLSIGGNIGLNGPFPDSIQYLTKLTIFYIHKCAIKGTFPNGFRYLKELRDFDIQGNPLNTFLPAFLGDLKKLRLFVADNTQLYGTIPQEMGLIDSLIVFSVMGNSLTGTVPNTFTNHLFHIFHIDDNRLDSLPKMSIKDYGLSTIDLSFVCNGNKFTFDDLLPTLTNLSTSFYREYNPQDSIFKDTTITVHVGALLSINLNIDLGIPDNNYKWFKNGVEVPSLFSQKNTLILRGVLPCDAGVYTCQVTNNRAPQLTLYSRKITLIVNPIVAQTRNKTICLGQKDTLPSGTIVAPTTTMTYRETLKNKTNTCDSAIVTSNLTVLSSSKQTRRDSFCKGQTYTFPDQTKTATTGSFQKILRGSNGCSDTINYVLTYKNSRERAIENKFCDSFRLPSGRVVKRAGVYRDSVNCDSVFVVTLVPDARCRIPSNGNCGIIETIITLGNLDGKNDRLELPEIVELERYPNNSIEIWNRWGQMLYTASPYLRDWSGKNQNGQDVPAGDYFFIVRVSIADGKCFMGTVYVSR